ncbi:undecaprenyl-phosphate alpha-N-acetylglucosaminyl 1-phosphate transferase [Lewinellaceae bacterium SD302]|nr:undecaprenyl-phosphate alpha-N-acetylglucosaminyl 1-phosphate transferase [Lewinellaceae bacterium SD302]
MPVVIRIALRKKLVAEIDDRSSHTELVPTLGGIPIFLAVLLSSFVLVPSPAFGNVQYILAGLLIIFLTGAKDDIEALSARKKTLGLLLGIGILIFAGDIRLQSMYGLFGYYGNLPYLMSVALTYFTIFVITNAFNLIDGINGLAGSLGAVVAISFGVWFGMSGLTAYGVLALAMVGGLMAFLRYNVSPAKIFMGDSGSLVLGATCAVFAIKFIDLCFSGNVVTPYCFNHPVAVAISFLIVPLFDTLRVFITRMYRGKSPFRPDRRHIHHLLIDTGRSHMEATIILLLVNITFISLVFALDEVVGMHYILLLEIILATVLTLILHRRARNARIEALNSMVV